MLLVNMSTKSRADIHRRRIEREIRKQQENTRPTIPRQSYSRLVQEIIQDEQASRGQPYDINLRADALSALQCAGEELLTDMFVKARSLASYNGRDTVNEKDLCFVNGGAAFSSTDPCNLEEQPQPCEPVE